MGNSRIVGKVAMITIVITSHKVRAINAAKLVTLQGTALKARTIRSLEFVTYAEKKVILPKIVQVVVYHKVGINVAAEMQDRIISLRDKKVTVAVMMSL